MPCESYPYPNYIHAGSPLAQAGEPQAQAGNEQQPDECRMIFKHLLPRARAWKITIDKTLKRFFNALKTALVDDGKSYLDDIYDDIFPQTTRELEAWERQFGLQEQTLTEQERRDRLDGRWKARGGQSPAYLQQVLRENGFGVSFVWDPWVPGSEPAPGVSACATYYDPTTLLRSSYDSPDVAGRGYPLANVVKRWSPDYLVLAGEAVAEAGEPEALAGNYYDTREEVRDYETPTNPDCFPYFWYIAPGNGPVFGQRLGIPAERREEFEALILKVTPAHTWVGLMVTYI